MPRLRILSRGKGSGDPPILKPRSHLGRKEKELWRQIAPILYRMNRLDELTRVLLELYCYAFVSWHDARRKLQRKRLDPKMRRIYRDIEKYELRHCMQTSLMFGFFFKAPQGMNLNQPIPLYPKRSARRKK